MSKGILPNMEELMVHELTEILMYCRLCDEQSRELLQVATCILSEVEADELVKLFTTFHNNMTILENLLAQVDQPIELLQAMAIKSVMRELKSNFDALIEQLEIANTRIDADEIDFERAKLVQHFLEEVSFDVIDYAQMEQTADKDFFIIKQITFTNEAYDASYYPLYVLSIESFENKVDAFKYALAKGLSRDKILTRYGAKLT